MLKKASNDRGKMKYSTTTWLTFQQKKQGEYLARRNGQTLAGLLRFLLQSEIDDFEQALDMGDVK